jgi:hypothetical protein
MTLSETPKNPTSLVSVQRTISMEFVFENPLASNNIGLGEARNKISSVILHESSIFIFHGMAPVGISEGIMVGLRDWR